MENETKFTGSCHCGTVWFETVMQPPTSGMVCNCSHCHRKGFVLAFIPRNNFTLTSGADNLTEYRFNKKQIAHQFCKTCGVQCFAYGSDQEGNETVAINLRTVDSIDTDTLEIQKFNGKDF